MATAIGFVEQIGNGIVGAVLTMWCIRSLPFEHRGQGMGIWGTCLVSGIFISPLLFSFMERTTGTVQNGFVIMGTICAVSAIIIPLLIRRTMPDEIILPATNKQSD
jgi:sugar phosphate permease